MTSARTFRHDIEGLRAISVLAVVLMHASVPGVRGGFIGVDVFFVISGFLIVGLLFDEAQAEGGRIDVLRFWSRRARRLLPNALLTLVVTMALSSFLLPGSQQETLTRDVSAAALYFANFRFASIKTDYFRFEDQPSAVLHYWSLSVEEQFYIVWPLALAGLLWLNRGGSPMRRTAVLLVIVWIASFVACVHYSHLNQPLAFFHTETRAWQLATGGILALAARAGKLSDLPFTPLFRWLGLAAIAACVLALDDAQLYPGTIALVPTLAAAVVIVAGSGTGAGAVAPLVLTHPVMQWLGARSYSWYLWHWPVMTFADGMVPEIEQQSLLTIPLSLLLAALAYRWVENPIRKAGGHAEPKSRTLAVSAFAIATVLATSFALRHSIAHRSPAKADSVASTKRASEDFGRNYSDGCHLDFTDERPLECIYGHPRGERTVVLFGDSHAAQWVPALDAAAVAAGWRLRAWTKSSCPSADVKIWYLPRRTPYLTCDSWREHVLEQLTKARVGDLVVISNLVDYGNWTLAGDGVTVLRGAEALAEWRRGFRALLTRLVASGVRVAVIRNNPTAYKGYRDCFETGGRRCDRPRQQALDPVPLDMEVARELGGAVTTLDLTDDICGPVFCHVQRNGIMVYQDRHHLTATFAATLAPRFHALLANAAR